VPGGKPPEPVIEVWPHQCLTPGVCRWCETSPDWKSTSRTAREMPGIRKMMSISIPAAKAGGKDVHHVWYPWSCPLVSLPPSPRQWPGPMKELARPTMMSSLITFLLLQPVLIAVILNQNYLPSSLSYTSQRTQYYKEDLSKLSSLALGTIWTSWRSLLLHYRQLGPVQELTSLGLSSATRSSLFTFLLQQPVFLPPSQPIIIKILTEWRRGH
jgi:hypothetical protein